MTDGHTFHKTLLREYDVRGIVGDTLNAADARALGHAFATVVARGGGGRVCVGYDGRLSSPELEAAVIAGLVAGGMEVERIGRCPTPMLYYAAYEGNADGAVMVTGSHNPPDYNGFKMVLGRQAFFGDQIQELGAIAAAGAFAEGVGSVRERPVFDDYVSRLLLDYRGERDLKVAWDPGNGAAGEVIQALTARLPGIHLLINDTIDGTFPSHHPDPTVEANLAQLRDVVDAEGCDAGLAFDGDGDRIGIIDGQGRVLWGDQLVALLAEDILVERPGATVIADVKASQTLFDHIAACGGKPLMWKTGHSLIKAKMAEIDSPLAGEMSGHIFIADHYYGFDDAIYAAVRVLNWLGREGRSLAAFRDSLPHVVNTPELRFDCPEELKFGVVSEVATRLRSEGAEVNEIDGVRVSTPDGWWLLRASNTQAVLVARCEAADEAGLARLKADLARHLRESGVELPTV